MKNRFSKIVDRPVDKPVITSKWVFKKKKGLSGAVEKYKARLVARGFMQEEGVDYTETYSTSTTLGEFGLHRSTPDFCVYTCVDGADRVHLGPFVDDIVTKHAIVGVVRYNKIFCCE